MPDECERVEAAGGIGNLALYRLCAEFPGHDNQDYVRSKLQIISRFYSVSRGLGGKWDKLSEAFVKCEETLCSNIEAASAGPFLENCAQVQTAHKFVDSLTCRTLKKAKVKAKGRASFASKYLHFYAPDSFPILDSLALAGLKDATPDFRRTGASERPYELFCERLAYFIRKEGREKESCCS